MKSWKKKKSFFQNRNMTFPIIMVLGVMLLFFNDMGIVKWSQLKQERLHIQTEIDRLLLEEKDLTAELDRLENDGEYIKKIARERFHMVMPGEKVFRVIDRRKVKKDQ